MNYELDTHTHTLASGHAYNTIDEMTLSAKNKGLKAIGITEHGPQMLGAPSEYYFLNLRALHREKFGVRRYFGTEVNILNPNGDVDLEDRDLNNLDIVIASMHVDVFHPGTKEENTRAVEQAVARHKAINILGHLDDSRYPLDYERCVRAAKEHHVTIEINNASLRPVSFRVNAIDNDREMLRLCKELQVPVTFGSDAHIEEDVADFTYAAKLVEEVGFPKEQILNYSQTEFELFLDTNTLV